MFPHSQNIYTCIDNHSALEVHPMHLSNQSYKACFSDYSLESNSVDSCIFEGKSERKKSRFCPSRRLGNCLSKLFTSASENLQKNQDGCHQSQNTLSTQRATSVYSVFRRGVTLIIITIFIFIVAGSTAFLFI